MARKRKAQRVDTGSFLGILLAAGGILGGFMYEGGSPLKDMVGPSAALIVFGGCLGATMLSHPEPPPLERGMTWSTVRLVRAPQYWHSQPSRANTARRVILRAAFLAEEVLAMVPLFYPVG